MSPRFVTTSAGGASLSRLTSTWYVSRTPMATLRFYWRGFWRALRPIPAGRPLPRPTRDF